MSKSLEEKTMLLNGYCDTTKCKDCIFKFDCENKIFNFNSEEYVNKAYNKLNKCLNLRNKNPNREFKLKDDVGYGYVIKLSPNYMNKETQQGDYKTEEKDIMCIECWNNYESFPEVSLSLNIKQIRKLKNYLKEVLNYLKENENEDN